MTPERRRAEEEIAAASAAGKGADEGMRRSAAASAAGKGADEGTRRSAAASAAGKGADEGTRRSAAASAAGKGADEGMRRSAAASAAGKGADEGMRRSAAASAIAAAASLTLVIGIGGGGDVAGALAAAEACAALGTPGVVGGLTWERRPIDPLPGPRRLDEIHGAQILHPAVALARPDTTGPGGFRFCEADMASFLGEPTVLVDPHPGPAGIAAGLDVAARHFGADLVLLLDVGGDVLAHGDERGLASPLADATLLAAARHMSTPVMGVVFGAGCDGELRPYEVVERLDEVAAAGGALGDLPLPALALDRVEAALEHVTTEASAMAVRCARGERGAVTIRGGHRTVELTAHGGRLACFEPAAAMRSAARLAHAVSEAETLEVAQEILSAMGVRTELDYEREAAAADRRGRAPIEP